MKKFGGGLFLLGIILTIISFREGIAGLKGTKNLYELEQGISEVGYFDMVYADVNMVFGAYATRTTTENGRKTGEDSYYLIPAYEGDEWRYIGVKVFEKEYDVFDQMIDDTYDYMDGYLTELDKHVEKVGVLKKMNKKMQDIYYKQLRTAEWFEDDEEMKHYALPYYIDSVANPKTMVGFFFFSIGAIVVGGVLFVIGYKAENVQINKAAQQTYVMIHGVSYAKAQLAHVNQCINNQEKIFAVQELAQITGLSQEEASNIVENWRQYYY